MPGERRRNEWLETDGRGGFASGTVDGIRTRRYHALLLAATAPPTGRFVLVNGVEAWIETATGRYPLTSQLYGGSGASDVLHPDALDRIGSFECDPWPRWCYELPNGLQIEHEIVARHGASMVAALWRLDGAPASSEQVTLCVRPLLSGRDYHALHHENAAFRFMPERSGELLTWHPYDGVPAIVALTNGTYEHDPRWYRNFIYEEERARGLDSTEDLASPGILRFDLIRGEAFLILAAPDASTEPLLRSSAATVASDCKILERQRRSKFPTRLHRSAADYVVERGQGRTIIAGYPWFADWGRDTFIALRGLCLSTGRIDAARDILLEWAGAISEGMVPNRFPDQGASPEFNSVDAALWYIVAVGDFCGVLETRRQGLAPQDVKRLQHAVRDILSGYEAGTRFGIRMDNDGLLRAGVPGASVTWMDAKVGDRAVTPRIGKPVEVQALWLNALAYASRFIERWRDVYSQACKAFEQRFWHEEGGFLYDVVDVDHVPGKPDASFRPNQIFAIGGLPLSFFQGDRARRIVDAVETRLWTPLGLRSLAPGEPGYAPRYVGDSAARDAAYHQGTVWPWLAGAFVEAWVRVRGSTPEARDEAHQKFLQPLLAHLDQAGLGHVSEIADAESPYTPRGCPFQAWSVGELLRLQSMCRRGGIETESIVA